MADLDNGRFVRFADDMGAEHSIGWLSNDARMANLRFLIDGTMDGFALDLYPHGSCDDGSLRYFGLIS